MAKLRLIHQECKNMSGYIGFCTDVNCTTVGINTDKNGAVTMDLPTVP